MRAASCGLAHPAIGERLAVVEEPVVDLAVLTLGCDDEHHAVPFVGGAGERTARRDRLVVGVGVEGDERAGHGAHRRAGARASLAAPGNPAASERDQW